MSLKETIQSFLEEHNSELESAFFHEGITEDGDEALEEELQQAGISFECVEQEGGEGEGEHYHTVYKFTTKFEAIYVKFEGWYQSYNGSEMTNHLFVTPQQKTVTVYE